MVHIHIYIDRDKDAVCCHVSVGVATIIMKTLTTSVGLTHLNLALVCGLGVSCLPCAFLMAI